MNKRIAIGIAVMAMAATAVHAATGDAVVPGGLWSATTTWAGGIVPGTLSATNIVSITGGATVTLDSSVPQNVNRIQVGQSGTAGTTGALIINSGASVTSTNSINVGMNRIGSFTMTGGNVTNLGTFNVACNGGGGTGSAAISGGVMTNKAITIGGNTNGTLSVTGGQLLGTTLTLGNASSNLFSGAVTLTGGSIELSTSANGLVINNGNTASKLTIGNTGELIWNDSHVADIATMVAASKIVWSSGSSTLNSTYGLGDQTWTNGIYFLHADYSSTDLKTRVWADTIPEPATIGMIGLGALITLLIRRMRIY